MAFNLQGAFASLSALPRGVGRAVFGPGRRPLRQFGAGLKRAFASTPGSSEDRNRTRRPTPQEEESMLRRDPRPTPAQSAAPAPTPSFVRRGAAPAAAASLPEISAKAGSGWSVTSKTRDQLGPSKAGQRQISLDFNDAAGNPRGVEIVVPQDATPEERAAAEAYVDATVKWYAKHGVKVPNRGVKVHGHNGQRGTTGRFHTEPFFVGDSAALDVMKNHSGEYAKILTETLGKIPGVTFHAPHKVNDPGATRGDLNERDFARGTIIPQLERLSRPAPGPTPQSPANPFLINPIL